VDAGATGRGGETSLPSSGRSHGRDSLAGYGRGSAPIVGRPADTRSISDSSQAIECVMFETVFSASCPTEAIIKTCSWPPGYDDVSDR
jgi:hypothetical protein